MMAKMLPMVSMELDDDDQLDCVCPIPMSEKPRFPYGLKICLTDKEMAKLQIDVADAFVGGIVHIHALARVTSVSQNDTEGGEQSRVELQVEDMCCVESEDEENAQAESSMKPKSVLYDR